MGVIVAGIDPSISGTAVCSGDNPAKFRMERYPTSRKGPGIANRVRRYEHGVSLIMDHLEAVKPSLILIEGYSFGSQNRAAEMGEYGGILRWHLADLTENIFEVVPTTMMKFMTGKGGCAKGQSKVVVANAIYRDFGQSFNSDDMSDAYAYYLMALAAASQQGVLKLHRAEALNTVFGDRLGEIRASVNASLTGATV